MRIKINFPQRFEHVEAIEIDAEAHFDMVVDETTISAVLVGGKFGALSLTADQVNAAVGEDEVEKLRGWALKNFDHHAAMDEHMAGLADYLEGMKE